jgi:hypothetical protein
MSRSPARDNGDPGSNPSGAHGLFRASSGPVLLQYEGALTEGRDSNEVESDSGFIVRATAETGEDVYLWTFAYRQQSYEVIIDADLNQTLLVYGEFAENDKYQMHDTPFINKGQGLEDFHKPGSLRITEGGEATEWSIAGRSYVSSPPRWAIRGEHAGVRCDIEIAQRGPAFFHAGKFEELKDDGIAGFLVHGTATGEIEVNGRILKISGYAGHERILQLGRVPPRMVYMGGRGTNWMHGFGAEFTWMLYLADAGPLGSAMITFDDEQVICDDPGRISVTEIGHWLDPRSHQITPCKWRVTIRTDRGELEATINGYGRAYYPWVRRGGSIVCNQFMADAAAIFRYPDGSIVESKQLAVVDNVRQFYAQPE